MAKRFTFRKKIAALKRLKRSMPKAIGVIMRNHYKKSFKQQGFTDASHSPWPKRDPDRSPGRAILIDSGELRDSIDIKKATFRQIRVGSYGVPYAKYHNRVGGKHPQRKFVGTSKVVTKKTSRLIHREVLKILK